MSEKKKNDGNWRWSPAQIALKYQSLLASFTLLVFASYEGADLKFISAIVSFSNDFDKPEREFMLVGLILVSFFLIVSFALHSYYEINDPSNLDNVAEKHLKKIGISISSLMNAEQELASYVPSKAELEVKNFDTLESYIGNLQIYGHDLTRSEAELEELKKNGELTKYLDDELSLSGEHVSFLRKFNPSTISDYEYYQTVIGTITGHVDKHNGLLSTLSKRFGDSQGVEANKQVPEVINSLMFVRDQINKDAAQIQQTIISEHKSFQENLSKEIDAFSKAAQKVEKVISEYKLDLKSKKQALFWERQVFGFRIPLAVSGIMFFAGIYHAAPDGFFSPLISVFPYPSL